MEKFLLDIIAKKAKYGKNSNIFDLMYETNLPYSAIKPLLDLMITRYPIERLDIETYRYIGDMCGSNREAESRETEYVSEQRRQALSMLMRVLEQRGRQLEKRSQGNDDDDDLDESSDRNRTALEALKAPRLSQLIQDLVDSEKDRLEQLEKDDDEYENTKRTTTNTKRTTTNTKKRMTDTKKTTHTKKMTTDTKKTTHTKKMTTNM